MQKLFYPSVFIVIFIVSGVIAVYGFQKNDLKNTVARICNTQTDVYACVKNESIKLRSVKPCYSLNAGINDKCIEEVYQSLGDQGLCSDITESGIRANCRTYFDSK